MAQLSIINDVSEIPKNDQWVPSTTFKEKLVDKNGKTPSADYIGRQFKLVAKFERQYTFGERFSRILQGLWAVVKSFGFGLSEKHVWKLFSKKAEGMRYGIFYETDSTKRKIYEDFTPQMVQALGGVEKVMAIPVLEDWKSNINIKQLTAKMMQGRHRDDTPFLLFCYLVNTTDGYSVRGEYLGLKKNEGWEGAYAYAGQINLRCVYPIKPKSLEEKHLLNRIERLVNSKPVGRLEQYVNRKAGHVILHKQKLNLEDIRPNNSSLQGEDLDKYLALENNFYERKIGEGTTDIALWDPSQPDAKNSAEIQKNFPNIGEISDIFKQK